MALQTGDELTIRVALAHQGRAAFHRYEAMPTSPSPSRPRRGLGILSWGGYATLARSLESYAEERLFDLFDEALVFLPDIQPEGIALAEQYGLAHAGSEGNLGILGGFKAMAEALSAEHVLLLENDCPLIEPHGEAARQLDLASAALTAGEVDVFRMRHREHPGQKFDTLEKHRRYHPPDEAGSGEKAMAGLRRLVRPGKAKRMIGGAPYAMDHPELRFPEHIQRAADGSLRVSSSVLNWTNQSVFLKRDFFLDTLIAYAEAHPSPRTVNGFPDIEKELNGSWWRRSGFTIGLDRGLFTHERVG